LSYGVRNTIILLVALLLLGGGAFAYIQFIQVPEIERLETNLQEKQQDYNNKKAISDAFPQLNENYQNALSIIENYDKSLYKTPNPDDVFDYLNYIRNSSQDLTVYFDFNFVDSTAQDQYGIIRSNLNGYGNYVNVVNFINTIENSQLLNKVSGLSLVPPGGNNEGQEITDITFNFTLESYYERIPIQENVTRTNVLTRNEQVSTYNPFYPLIQPTVPPNTDNLINVEQSRIIGMTASRIFIVDQGGSVQSLTVGDDVYLGSLQSIDINNKSATFNLNKGGITELVTLEIER
jgi:Tfp pilus assembly protein PilO